jgi:hypothetical protein
MEQQPAYESGGISPGCSRKALPQSGIRILIGVYLGLLIMTGFLQDWLIYHPVRTIDQRPADIGLEYEDINFTARDGAKISAWYVPASGKGSGTIIFCHGNAGNIGHRLDKIAIFHGLGVGTLIFDYRGYGQSSGRPSEEGTYLDAEAAYDWLVKQKDILPGEIVAYGESLGGAVAAHLAARRQCGGLVLEGAFTSAADVGGRFLPFLPVRWIVGKKYDMASALAAARCPVLVIHTREDEIVPFDLGQRLFRQANEPKRFLEMTGSHNEGFLESQDAYVRGLRDWLAEWPKLRSPQAPPAARTLPTSE